MIALIDAWVETVLGSVVGICFGKYRWVSSSRDKHIARYHPMQGGGKHVVTVRIECHIDRGLLIGQPIRSASVPEMSLYMTDMHIVTPSVI